MRRVSLRWRTYRNEPRTSPASRFRSSNCSRPSAKQNRATSASKIGDVHRSGLWTERSFALLWTGQTISQLGSQVTLVPLPLTAIVLLNANPVQVGL